VSSIASLASIVNSSNAASLGSVAVAELGLELVQLLRGAMQGADLSVAAQAHSAPAAQSPSGDHFTSAVPSVKVVYQPARPTCTSIPPRYIAPDIGPALPKQFCDTDPPIPAAPAPVSVPPFQPPWKTLPWPKPRLTLTAASPGIVFRQVPTDHVGQMLDLFV